MLHGKSLAPFISEEIRKKSKPILFRPPSGGRASGYNATLLPDVCEVYLRARETIKLRHQLDRVAQQAEIIVRALANVGIIAWVDEATGYQEVRASDALARILEEFIA